MNRSCAVAIAIEGEYTLGSRIVEDAIRVRRGICLAHNFQRPQIENDRLALCAIADESASLFRN